MVDLLHYHESAEGNSHRVPPACCQSALQKAHHRAVDVALRDERGRIVKEAAAAIHAYRVAASSVLKDPDQINLVATVASQCVKAIRAVGCICPLRDASTLGQAPGTNMVPGGDPLCGVHGGPDG